MRPEPGRPHHFLSAFEIDGQADAGVWEYWTDYLTTTISGVKHSGLYRVYNSYYLVDRFDNVTFGYGNTTSPTTPQNLSVAFANQLLGGPEDLSVSYPGYETDISWSNAGGSMPADITVPLTVTFGDPEYGSGNIVRNLSLRFISGVHSALISQQDYDLRFGVDDGAWPMTVSPGASGAALPTTKDPRNPDPEKQVTPRRLNFQVVTGTTVPRYGEVFESPHNVWRFESANYVLDHTESPDPHLEVSEPGRMKLSVVDSLANAVTDVEFQVHNCPRYDHEGPPNQPAQAGRPCADPPVRSTGGVIATFSINPAGSSRGYMGVELLRAPLNPGTYFIRIESLDSMYRIRQLPGLTVDRSAAGEFKGAFALCVVQSIEILDANFQRTSPIVVTQPTTAFVRVVDPSQTTSTYNVNLSTTRQDGTVLTSSTPLSLARVGASPAFLSAFTLIPERCPTTSGGACAGATTPSWSAAFGAGRAIATAAAGQPSGFRNTADPAILKLRFLTRDGSALTPSPDPAHPELAGTVQQTEIGDQSDGYAEIVRLEIRAENLFDWTQLQDTSVNVTIQESRNPDFLRTANLYYTGDNGSTYLDPTDQTEITARSLVQPLSHGKAQVLLKAVADARRMLNGSFAPLAAQGYTSSAGARLTPQPLPPADISPLQVGVPLSVAQWVDERTYERRRPTPTKAWTSTDTWNNVRDWLEKKSRDVWTDTPDDATGEVGTGCNVITTVAEDAVQTEAGIVLPSTPEKVTFNPLVAQLRHPDPAGLGWNSWYYGFYRHDPADGFAPIALHESRHSWQFTLASRGGVDVDGDLLFAPGSVPAASAELLDAPNIIAPGGANGDGHFKGDGPGLEDPREPVQAMLEHNAMRFTRRNSYSTNLKYAYSVVFVVCGDNQSGPPNLPLPQSLQILVMAKASHPVTGQPEDKPVAGATVKFEVTNGTATFGGNNVAYAMTNRYGDASVVVTNGTSDSTITAQFLPPMASQIDGNLYPDTLSPRTFVIHVQ